MIMGVLLGIAVIGDASLQLIYAMVLAICCAAVGEYTRFGIVTSAVVCAFSLNAVWCPEMCWLLPVIAVDAAAVRGWGAPLSCRMRAAPPRRSMVGYGQVRGPVCAMGLDDTSRRSCGS